MMKKVKEWNLILIVNAFYVFQLQWAFFFSKLAATLSMQRISFEMWRNGFCNIIRRYFTSVLIFTPFLYCDIIHGSKSIVNNFDFIFFFNNKRYFNWNTLKFSSLSSDMHRMYKLFLVNLSFTDHHRCLQYGGEQKKSVNKNT